MPGVGVGEWDGTGKVRVVSRGTAGAERNLARDKEEWAADGWSSSGSRCQRRHRELARARPRSRWLLVRGSHSGFLWLP